MRHVWESALLATLVGSVAACHGKSDDAPPPPPAATSIPQAPAGAIGEDHAPPSTTAMAPPHPIPPPHYIPPDVNDPFAPPPHGGPPMPHDGSGGGGTAL